MSWERALGTEQPDPATTTRAGATTVDRPRHQAPTDDTAERAPRPSIDQQSPRAKRARRRARKKRLKAAELATTHKRLDIQGLRALAVVAVVINHMTDHPQGGFLGVDVFFVISGYLITGLMLRDEDRNERGISLLTFYRRRVKRLFPAALTVTVLTVLFAYLLFPFGRFKSVVWDGLAATVFGANWRFMAIGTDYFASFGPVSPLRHYWSLSVEEQFYVVWPITLIAAFAIAKLSGTSRRRAALTSTLTAAVLLTAVSLFAAITQTADNPVTAYFSTLTRGWELGLGAILAIVVPYFRAPQLMLTAMSWLGLAAIGVSFFTVTENQVPYPGALYACVGAALVIAAVSGTVPARNVLLTNPVATYLGDISYSIYLIHFPVIVFAAAVLGDDLSVAQQLALACIIVGASVALYSFVENPLRSRPWTFRRADSRTRRRRKSERSASWKPTGGMTQAISAVVALAALTVGFGVFALAKGAPNRSAETQAAVDAALASAAAQPTATGTAAALADPNGVNLAAATRPAGPALAALKTQLAAALAVTEWPDISPSFDNPTFDDNRGCATGPLKSAAECTWGNPDAANTMYLVGDSTSAAYFGAFSTLIQNHPDWNMRLASGSGCPFSATQINEGDANVHLEDCPGRNAALVAEIQQTKPELVIFTSSRGKPDYIAAIDPQLAKIRPSIGGMVVLPNGPYGTNPNTCYTTVSKPADCISPVPADYQAWMSAEYDLAQKYDATFIDPTPWFCVATYCPSFVGTTPVHKDDRHMTAEYSKMLAPVIDEALTLTKVLA